jgi:hypothetical protein
VPHADHHATHIRRLRKAINAPPALDLLRMVRAAA